MLYHDYKKGKPPLKWTDFEEQRLIYLKYFVQTSNKETAKLINRSEDACSLRLAKIRREGRLNVLLYKVQKQMKTNGLFYSTWS